MLTYAATRIGSEHLCSYPEHAADTESDLIEHMKLLALQPATDEAPADNAPADDAPADDAPDEAGADDSEDVTVKVVADEVSYAVVDL